MSDYLTDPVKLQFEISSMCNALCLGCVRTDSLTFNNKKNLIPDKQILTLETFKKIILSPAFVTVKEIEYCGTIDDPLMHPEFLDMLEFLASIPNREFGVLVHTNASLRDPEYFVKLAQTLNKFPWHIMKFSIDGLEDTNSIYRQNTSWKKIIANAQAFIDAGGSAYWQYLIFPWNEHQLMQAKALSDQMGFKEFVSRHDRSIATATGLEKIQKIKVGEISKKPNSYSVEELLANSQTIAQDSVNCNTQSRKMFFIGYDSRLWPCCFIHNGFVSLDSAKVDLLTKQLLNSYDDTNWNRLDTYTVEEVLAHDFYRRDLATSWQSNQHGLQPVDRIIRCSEVCGVKKLEQLPIGNYKVIS